MSHSRQRVVLLSVMAVLTFLLAACGGDDSEPSAPTARPTFAPATPGTQSILSGADLDADGDGFLTVDEHVLAFGAAFDDYRWPEQYTPNVATMLRPLENGGPGDLFQIELEHTVIEFWNECAWYMAWLDAFRSGDSAARAEALQVITDVLPANKDPDGAESLTGVAASAALGDPSQIVSRVEGIGGCRGLEFDEES